MPKTNHRFFSAKMESKKMQKFGIFSKIKTPILIGQFISAIIIATTIATPAMAFKDYKCGCGSHSDLYNRPTCYAPPDYLTEYCIVSKTNDTFTYRVPDGINTKACSLCWCYGYTDSWRSGTNGALVRTVYTAKDTSATQCDYSYEDEAACNSGYYGLHEPDFMVYACEECPWLEDKYGTMLHGWTEYANTNTDITDCYIRKEDTATGVWFEDDTGQYAITDDCYYSL